MLHHLLDSMDHRSSDKEKYDCKHNLNPERDQGWNLILKPLYKLVTSFATSSGDCTTSWISSVAKNVTLTPPDLMPETHRDFLWHLLPVCENIESHCYNAYTDWSLQYAPAKIPASRKISSFASTDSAGTSDFLFDKTTHPSSLPENSSETAGSHLH